jgi:hypothetical protein
LRGTRSYCFLCMLSFSLATSVLAQEPEHNAFEGWCDNLRSATPHDLVEFLSGIRPDQNNARCVTWAINKLGQERYEPAIQVLVRLLGFRRPETRHEEMGFHDLAISMVPFPATEALAQIGARSQPEVLRAIGAESTSSQARENAVGVLMTLNQSDHAKAIACLKGEQSSSANYEMKERFASAMQQALRLCTASEQNACRKAATSRSVR